MRRSLSVDWIRGTFEWEPGFIPQFLTFEDEPQFKKARSLFSYNAAVESELITLCWHTDKPEMRVMFQMTGKQISKARQMGHSDRELITWLWEHHMKFTRLDMALDIFNGGGKVLEFRDAWNTEALTTSAQKMTAIESEGTDQNNGNTVYIGSRQSTRMVRIYDKGKQQGTSLDWIRVEMEWKQDRAAQAARDIKESGLESAAISHLRKFIPETLIGWFEEAITSETPLLDIEAIPRPITNHERWIFEVCIPAVMAAVENGVPGVLDAVVAILMQADDRSEHGPSPAPRQKNE